MLQHSSKTLTTHTYQGSSGEHADQTAAECLQPRWSSAKWWSCSLQDRPAPSQELNKHRLKPILCRCRSVVTK
jgi:hypothetical protein